jgi:integrase
MKAMTRQQLDVVLAVAKAHSEDDYVALLIGFNHGLRVSEILSLTPANIVNGCLVIQRLKGSRKTVQPLLPSEIPAIAARVAAGVPFFNICRKTLWSHMKNYCAEAGVPFGRDFVAVHSLKHSCGRLGFKGGMTIPEVQAYLGHKNGANTMVYLQATEEEAANAFAAAVGA